MTGGHQMPLSMTGFGRATATYYDKTISVEIKTVNHRFLDVSIKTPQTYQSLESDIRDSIQRHFQRGRVECFIMLDNEEVSPSKVNVNWPLMNQYVDAYHSIQNTYNLSTEEALAFIPKIPEIISISENVPLAESVSDIVLGTVQDACDQVILMRSNEGKMITDDMKNRLENIKQLVKQLGERRETVIIEYQGRILSRIHAFTDGQLHDEARFYQEVAILAEKGDITEEITRLHSHVQQFGQTLNEEQVVGRKLGFILQEMQREVNTIGSKSNDALISNWVVTLKTEMEKIKEQIQNIE